MFLFSGILLASGVPHHRAVNAIRLSVGRETTTDDIDTAIEDLKQSVTTLSRNASSIGKAVLYSFSEMGVNWCV